jgi:RHS repeat-associated protein
MESGQPILQTNKYFYNQSGIRVREEMTGSVNQTNVFLNDPQNLTGFSQVLEELPTAGATPAVSYTLGSQIISQEKGGTNLYFMADGHGSTRLLTDTNGTISDRYSYDAYGVALDFTFGTLAPPRTAMLYSGERFDSDLQRYYNPTVGRFCVQDQKDGSPNDPLNLHKYAYCQNDPVNMHDPTGNQGDLISLTLSMSIASDLEWEYDKAVLKQGYIAAKKVTEMGAATESLWEIVGQDKTADTATIIVHGVAGHENGWSQSRETPFQQNLSAAIGATPTPGITGDPLNHDFYEFDWGGFSIANAPPFLYPIKSVHEMALVHLQMAEFYVWMNGYANIDVISHSWGTCLSYDLLNNSSIEVHDWVTMGSVLKESTDKPVGVTGKWINMSSHSDFAYYTAFYPPFPNGISDFLTGLWAPNVHTDPSVDKQLTYDFGSPFSHWAHSDYWNRATCSQPVSDLRHWLQ